MKSTAMNLNMTKKQLISLIMHIGADKLAKLKDETKIKSRLYREAKKLGFAS